MPAPHCVVRQGSISHFPVVWLQNLPWVQIEVVHLSGRQAPATQRSSAPHLPGRQRSVQVPLLQNEPAPQVTPLQGSVLHTPATQILSPVQASSGELQSRQRPSTQIAGELQET